MSTTLVLFTFFAGLLPLWIMFRQIRFSGLKSNLLVFSYCVVQHIAFGLGSILVALFDEGYTYINLQGEFLYSDGLEQLAFFNMVALYAGLAGFFAKDTFLWVLGKKNTSETKNTDFAGIINKYKRELIRIGLISLGIHFFVILLQFLAIYNNTGESLNYIVQLLAKVTPSAFFFVGLIFNIDRRTRWIFLFYFILYGSLQLSSGGRATVLYGVLIFLLGVLCSSPEKLFSRSALIVISALFICLPILSVNSENARLLRSSRILENFEDISKSMGILFFEIETPKTDSWGHNNNASISGSMFRFGARLIEVSLLDIALKTPGLIPHSGFNQNDFNDLVQRVLPVSLRPVHLPHAEERVMILHDYGWAVDPAGGTSFPVTLLGDSWIRFGWLGIMITHFSLALIITTIPYFLGRNRTKLIGLVILGPLTYMIAFSYTNDIIGMIVILSRAIILSGIFSALLCLMVSSRNK